MKMFRIICVSAAILIPQLVLAKLPFPNDAFGKVEGILDFCAKADPQSAAKYQAHKKALVKDVPEKEVAEARQATQRESGRSLRRVSGKHQVILCDVPV